MNKAVEIALIIGTFLVYLYLRIENFGFWWIYENTENLTPFVTELLRGVPIFLVIFLLRYEKELLDSIFRWKLLLTALVITFFYGLPLVFFVYKKIHLEYFEYPNVNNVLIGFLINVYYFVFFYYFIAQKTKLGYFFVTFLLFFISFLMHGVFMNDPWYGYHSILDIFLLAYLYVEWKYNLP